MMLEDIECQRGEINGENKGGKIGYEEPCGSVISKPTHHDRHRVTAPDQRDIMKGVGHLRRKCPPIEGYNGVIWNRYQEENEPVAYIFPFIVSQIEFYKEIEQENYADPELEMNEAGFKIEGFVMESV